MEELPPNSSTAAQQKALAESLLVPVGWNKQIHPDGTIYYFNEIQRIITPEDVTHDAISNQVMSRWKTHMDFLCKKRRFFTSFPADDWEFTICLPSPEKKVGSASVHSWALKGIYKFDCEKSDPVDQYLEGSKAEVWEQVANYPTHRRRIPPGMEVDFMSALAHGATEIALDIKATTFPYNGTQTKSFMRVYHDLKVLQQVGQNVTPALAWHMGKVMGEIERSRQKYSFGTRDARIYRNVAISKPTWGVRVLDVVISLLFFGVHKTYRKRLATTQPNGTPYLPDFRKLMQSFLVEWADSNLVATVFVSANVGFLAVPGINSLQRTASLASSLLSMTSIVTGLHHVWQHRERTEADNDEAYQYLHHVKVLGHADADLTVTACFLSIPLASLLWSVISFGVSVGAFCVQGSTESTGKLVLVVLLGVLGTSACAMLLFFWQIWKAPRHTEIEAEFNINTDLNVDPVTGRAKFLEKVKSFRRRLAWTKKPKDDVPVPDPTPDSAPVPVEKVDDIWGPVGRYLQTNPLQSTNPASAV
ncbi:hypothetical protein BD779DRAFT_544492 [Infundibulicybe gibba]|nr:hypothetical protein BD779DRAFT_544492 [Infundibulicybe gibba]